MKKYVMAGASYRGLEMYALPLVNKYSDGASLAGIFDVNRGRAEYIANKCGNVRVYDDFDPVARAI